MSCLTATRSRTPYSKALLSPLQSLNAQWFQPMISNVNINFMEATRATNFTNIVFIWYGKNNNILSSLTDRNRDELRQRVSHCLCGSVHSGHFSLLISFSEICSNFQQHLWPQLPQTQPTSVFSLPWSSLAEAKVTWRMNSCGVKMWLTERGVLVHPCKWSS